MKTAKPINFEPTSDTLKVDLKKDTRTAAVVKVLLRKKGATIKDVVAALNKVGGGSPLDEKKARTWLSASFLAPLGVGVRTEVTDTRNGPVLRFYGYVAESKEKAQKKAA